MVNPVSSHVYNQFVIQTAHRNELQKYLQDAGIETGVQFPLPMHQQPVYNQEILLPVAEKLSKNCLSLPVHAFCTPEDIYLVCTAIKNFFN